MAVGLALLAALAYGTSDFAAGLASRRFAAQPVAGATQLLGLLTAGAAVFLFPGIGPTATALGWGAVSGLGSGAGVMALYHGLTVARISVVVTLSAVLTAVIPTIVGVALGNHLTITAAAGIVIAIPAIGLVSWEPRTSDGAPSAARAGLLYGLLAGLGFALLFIALDQAGTRTGAWPILPGQLVSLLLIAPFAYRGLSAAGKPGRTTALITVAAGILSGVANLLFLAATGRGQLAIVGVITSLYPVFTVLLARVFLAERWTRLQAAGLLTAGAAIVLVTIG